MKGIVTEFTIPHDAMSIGEFAEKLQQNGIYMGRNELFKWLRQKRILLSDKAYWNQADEEYLDRGWLQHYIRTCSNETGTHTVITTLITAKGREAITRMMKKERPCVW